MKFSNGEKLLTLWQLISLVGGLLFLCLSFKILVMI